MKEHKQVVEQGSTDISVVASGTCLEQGSHSGLGGCRSLGQMEWYKRCVLESWHIQSEPAAMNKDK